MKKAPWVYGLLLGLAIVATAKFAPPKSHEPSVVAAPTVNETWTIPGVGLTPGLNDTLFVSDLALTNLGVAPANVTLTFVGPGSLPPQSFTLEAGATRTFRNVIDALWDITGVVGALSVQSDQPLVLRARTYNTAATGTFGVSLPVYSSSQLLAEGQDADSIWVQQDPSASSGFRTNVGVVFPDAGGGDAVVTLYDAAGAIVGTLDYSSTSAGFQQQSVASAAPAGLPIGRAQIQVTRGHSAGYAVGVDNVTGDTSLYPLESLPAGVQDVVVSGVARLPGRNNTFFRTDARFYNPTPDDATVTARFHSIGTSNPVPQSATVTVPAGRVIESVDVLDSILHLPVGSGGAVRFTSNQPIAILARTSNVDPQGAQPGTFGAQQRPVLLASYLSSADAGAVVTAIRQDASFRTNIGFAAGPDGAAYNLTLRSAQGASVAVTTGSLGAFGWAQPSIADLFPGTTIPADATLLVQVTSGTVDVYDASLDNASGDLVVTPIAPLPLEIPSSAQIGPAGGSIRSADGRLTLKIPAGALAAPTTLSIAPTVNTAPNAIGSAYSLSPIGLAFARPAQLALSYAQEDLAGTGAGALGLASQEGTGWLAILGGSVDPVTRTLRVPVPSTSPGPASAGARRIPLRAAANGNVAPYASVSIEPAERSVAEEGQVQLAVNYAGPSSSASSSPGYAAISYAAPPGLTAEWNITAGQIATVGPVLATYTAPRCVVTRRNPVRVQASVRDPNGRVYIALAHILVIPKRWYIDVSYRVQRACPQGSGQSLYSFYFEQSHTFSTFEIVDNVVRNFTRGPGHTNTEGPAVWCLDTGCSQPQVTLVGDTEVTDVTGGLLGQGLNPTFDLFVSADFPGTGAFFTFTCGTGQITEPVEHALPGSATRQIQIPFSDKTWSITIPHTGETVTVNLRPRPCP